MVLWTLIAVVVLATLIPISKLPHGAVRTFSFARQQIVVLAAICAVTALAVLSGGTLWLALALLAGAVGIHLVYLSPFLPVTRVQTRAATGDEGTPLTILTCNVRLSNRDFGALCEVIREERPDLVLLSEIDQGWVDGLDPLAPDFPHREWRAMDSGFGMGVMSRHPFVTFEWRELLIRGVPSARLTLALDDQQVAVWVIHPEPPVPTHDTEGRDAEIGLVALEVQDHDGPAIVAGDLNDVAWSHTTRRFQRLSGLQDPRIGRGFYNTFHAQIQLMRWPLDHLFHSDHFRLRDMRRLRDVGSDHFPMLFALALTAQPGNGATPDDPDARDRAEIRRMAMREARRDRDPVGDDWEEIPD